ncbi:MAG TPA: hypothetical protein VM409_07565 [Chloroflexia bacterium]|nr:hypothetical protein [Chloroflexia bacterium]
MNRARSLLLWLGLAVVVIQSIGSSGGSGALAQGDRTVWAQVAGAVPSSIDLNAVFLVDSDNAWVAGGTADGSGRACKLERRAERWSSLPCAQLRSGLTSIVALPDGSAWAVGGSNLVAHYTGGAWREEPTDLPSTGLPANLSTLQMLGNGSEGWAAGFRQVASDPNRSEPVLLHYIGGNWTVDGSITGPGGINSLHFTGGAGWAVGSAGIWRYERGSWHKEVEPAPCGDFPGCYPTLSHVRAVSAEEAWIVGSRSATCGICVSLPYALHRTGGQWQVVLPNTQVPGPPILPSEASVLTQSGFVGSNFGLAVGFQFKRDSDPNDNRRPMALRFDGTWRIESLPDVTGQLFAVSVMDTGHALAVGPKGLIIGYGYGSAQALPTVTPVAFPFPTSTSQPAALPTDRVPDPHDPNVTYFGVVGHTLRGNVRAYWLKYGGLPQFGYPITEEFPEVSSSGGKLYTVQYFERARFEYHPENKPPYDVLLGLLGNTITTSRRGEMVFQPVAQQHEPGVLYFRQTSHNIAVQFSAYWQAHGGLPVYGYPITEAFPEKSPTDGKTYLVQYFERNRLEYHPELPEPFRVSLGLLGVEVLRERGWLPR